MAVYMIRASGGDIKIGMAKDPLARLRQMQTGMPQKLRIVRVLEGGRAEEQALHTRFATQRVIGEWFKFHEDMLGTDLGWKDLPIPPPRNGWDTGTVTARDPVLEDALSRKGAVKRVADACEISAAAVCQWKRVPLKRVDVVAAALGLDPESLRQSVSATR